MHSGIGLALRLFLARRYQFAKLLESSKSALTASRFIRLIALASCQIAVCLPILIVLLVRNIQNNHLQPYASWADVHAGFGYVGGATLDQWTSGRRSDVQITELNSWLPVITASLFFLFFGLGEESLSAYRAWGASAMGLFRRPALATKTP